MSSWPLRRALSPRRIAAASIALALAVPALARADGDWRLTLDTLVYDDTDRVTAVTPRLSVSRRLDEDGGRVGARVLVDVVSAASVDVISHATRGFLEARTEVGFDLAKAFEDQLPSVGYRFSIEPDYQSHTGSVGWRTRLGTPDSVLSLGYALSYDVVGRTGVSWEAFSGELFTHAAHVSLTQTLGPETVLRGVFSVQVQEGFLEKPYRHVSLFDAAVADQANASNFDQLRRPERPPEAVPDLRVGYAGGLRLLQSIDPIGGSVRVDYQLYLDDWGLSAHTAEAALTGAVLPELSLVGYARFYTQTAASFWERTYTVDEAGRIPGLRTADRDLSPYESLTGGARLEWRVDEWGGYVDGAIMWTHWNDFLLLDDRVALIGMAGLRWSP